jgi:preprotein translocase subunit SecA
MPPETVEEQWNVPALEEAILRDFNVQVGLKAWLDEDANRGPKDAIAHVTELVEKAYAEKEALVGSADLRRIERTLMLQLVDQHWREHLAAMDYMRQGIFLRSYAQKNPKQEYKREAFELFQAMLGRIRSDTVTLLSRMQIRSEAEIEREERERAERMAKLMQFQHAAPAPVQGDVDPEVAAAAPPPPVDEPRPLPQNVTPFERPVPKVGRNEPCPCGSGKKFKHCHGQLQQEA